MQPLSLDEFKQHYQYNQSTPILQQYLDIKFEHQDCVVFFRLGDFYELFYEDAVNMSRLLGLTLTKRSNKEKSVAMCGVPYHAANTYLPKIIQAEHKIAICEQLESPQEAKKRSGSKAVVDRQVVRIITQGTIFEESLLGNEPNYLLSMVCKADQVAICYLDISTLDFNVRLLPISQLASEVMGINPREIIASQNMISALYLLYTANSLSTIRYMNLYQSSFQGAVIGLTLKGG